MVVGQAGGHAVVEDHPVFLAHQAVARLADVELGPGVGVDPVEELPRVRALDVDLAQGRGVEQADRLAHRAAFAGHGGVHVLAAAREVPRPLPLADVFELGAVLHVPGVQGGEAHRFEQVPAVAAGDGAEGHRGVVRTEHGGAGVGDALALGPRGDRQAVDVAQLALVGAEAQRGVALDVLDGLEALAAGQFDGGGGDVVLRIDELLWCACRGLLVGHLEQRDGRFLAARLDLRQAAGGGLVAGVEGGAAPGLVAVGEHLGEPEHAVHGAGADAFLQAFAGDESEDFLAPFRLAAQVRGQVHDRAVAAGAGDQVAVQPFAAAGAHGLQVDPGDLGAADPLAAASLDHRTAGDHPHTALACFLDPLAARIGPGVGDGHHLQAGFLPVEGDAVGVVVVGGQHQFLARCHAVAPYIGGNRAGEHVAGQVVVAVDQRPLMGAGGQYHALSAHAVHTLADLAERGDLAEVVGAPLVDGEEVVVVVAVDRGAR
ncbi:Uncharacterised protein [Klebsiella pneumoniae]|nr:Uncharacterised protein [Klebsiella pneumoniae]